MFGGESNYYLEKCYTSFNFFNFLAPCLVKKTSSLLLMEESDCKYFIYDKTFVHVAHVCGSSGGVKTCFPITSSLLEVCVTFDQNHLEKLLKSFLKQSAEAPSR